MNAHSDRQVNGQAPDWSRRGQGFRHLDGSRADWRSAAPARSDLARRHRTGLAARMRRFARAALVVLERTQVPRLLRALRSAANFETILLGPACNKRDVAIFVVGMLWGVMCSIGMLAAWGIRP